MSKFNLYALSQPEVATNDPLHDLIRQGARDLIARAVESERAYWISTPMCRHPMVARRWCVMDTCPSARSRQALGMSKFRCPRSGTAVASAFASIAQLAGAAHWLAGTWPGLCAQTGRGRRRSGLRCWVHKTANVLDKLPKSIQPKVKSDLHEIYLAETREGAHKAFDSTLKRFREKYTKDMENLEKDRDELLAFYDFPAAHWIHLRTTNPIESTFATVRLRTKRSRSCGSRDTTLSMVFKLLQSARKRWKRIKGFNQLKLVVNNVQFRDGERVDDQSGRDAVMVIHQI